MSSEHEFCECDHLLRPCYIERMKQEKADDEFDGENDDWDEPDMEEE